jgi:hypothetical protein
MNEYGDNTRRNEKSSRANEFELDNGINLTESVVKV